MGKNLRIRNKGKDVIGIKDELVNGFLRGGKIIIGEKYA
jgi:hypothetical protein